MSELRLLTPMPDQVLTMEDDVDPSVDGLQLDVTGVSVGLRAGTPIDLYIDGDDVDVEGEIADDSTITLPAVTLPPGEHRIHLVAGEGTVRSDDQQKYTLRALVIDSPDDGDVVVDSDASAAGVQARVVVEGFALEGDGEVTLFVDDDELRSLTVDDQGRAVFSGVTLAPGSHTLQARSGSGESEIRSEEIDVEVTAEDCPSVSFVAPVAPSEGDVVLGGARCPASGPFTTRVEISTEAVDGTSVELTAGGEVVATAEVDNGGAVFEGVELATDESNQLAVRFEGEAGMSCATAFPAEILVDCDSPSCAFRGPVPYVVDGDDTLYLGAAQAGDEGFDIEVEAGEGGLGQTVTLVIDEEEGDALTATAENDGGDAVATFAGIELAEGSHTLSARCRDESGNVTTRSIAFVVDTVACGVSITSPADDSLVLPADDADGEEDGTQVIATTVVEGDDCTGQRVALCDGELPDGAFESFDGTTPFDTSLTLEAPGELEVCAEIQDRAGNVARTSRAFRFRDSAPMLAIESPNDGDNFNALGNGDYERDNDRSEESLAVCDAEVWVACTELGTDVVLHRDDAEGAVIAMGPCEEHEAGDDELPEGFSGRAKIQAVLDDGDEATTIIATQTLMGTSSELLGSSASIDLGTDCLLPDLTVLQSPCTLHASMQVPFTEADDLTVLIADQSLSPDITSASLSFTNEAMTVGPLTPDTLSASAASFDNINFTEGVASSDEGPLTVTITVSDNFDNVAESVCASALVNDLPAVTSFTAPPDESVFGPGEQTCPSTVPGEYRLRVQATIDQNADRTVSVLVNDEVVLENVTLEDTAIDTCVAMPDDMENEVPGPSTVTVLAESDLGIGEDFITHTVSVQTLEILDPQPEQLIVSGDNCADTGFGYEVAVAVDPIHDGAEYTLTSGAGDVTGTVSGTSITECVPFDVGGERTLTVSIDGTPIAYSVGVVVVDDTPEIVSIDTPADDAEFGVGDATCAPEGGGFGVRVQATLDQADNREVNVLVNGLPAATDVAIDEDDATIDVCVAVPDDLNHTPNGPSTITVELDAVLGEGSVSESVTLMVDTLDIVDPVADQQLFAEDDCDSGAGYGYEVELAVDPSHEGRTYNLTGGASLVSGTIDDSGSLTHCVPLTIGGERTITATISDTAISESVTVETLDDTPEIVAIVSPTSGESFGIDGEECDAGPLAYGIDFVATVDQAANRRADISVNGVVVASDVAIDGTTISTCIALPDNMTLTPDGASTIMLELSPEVGPGAPDTASVTANLDTLEIDSPLAGADLVSGDDCDPSPSVFGVTLVADADPSLNTLGYSITGGTSVQTGTVTGGAISHCVPVAIDSAVTLTLSIGTTGISESRSFDTFDDTPEIVSITSPSSGESFVIDGEDCDAGTPYGVTFIATVDQAANRRADILVNGVEVASNVAIVGTTVTACVPLPDNMTLTPDGASTITLELSAVVGTGSDSASVTANLDTLEIDSPLAGADLVSADDCDPSPSVFGAQLVADADPSLNGQTYSISGGTSVQTGTVAGGAISHCVPVAVGSAVTLTLSIGTTGISESRSFDTFDDTPEIVSITSPSSGESFVIDGEDCDAGTAYGVTFTATVDQAANREADILVNGVVVASDVAIVGTTVTACIPLPDNMTLTPDGASTITLELSAVVGTGSDSASVTANLDTLEIDSPLAGETLFEGDDCDTGAAFGVELVADADPSLNGQSYSITGGTSTVNGTVASGAITACVPVAMNADVTLTLTIGATGISESRSFETLDDTPSITAITAPTSGQVFGIDGAECPAGSGNYGIFFSATVDQAENRDADVLVNGVEVASDVPITGTSLSTCIALPDNMSLAPDGASTLTLELSSVAGTVSTVTSSVTANLDTLEIDSPTVDEVLVSADDCDPSASVYGAQLVADVDPSHNTRGYTITGGDSTVTGTIAGGAISACVPVEPNGEHTLTLAIDGTGISESRSFETLDDTAEIVAITAPADGSSYGVGEQECDAGAGTYGLTFTAEVDQQANRSADVQVNGISTGGVTISAAGIISTCIPVPDNFDHALAGGPGPSEVTLTLTPVVGTGGDSETVFVNVDTMDLTSPTDGQTITSASDCDTGDPDVDFEVSFDVDAARDGDAYTISGGSSPITGTIDSTGAVTTITRCVPLDAGEQTITVSIDDTSITESVDVTVEADAPAIVSFTSPLDAAAYGPGDQDCDAGAGEYGVLVEATIDQTANREVDILIDDVLFLDNVTLTADAISECVPVALTGSTEITVEVSENPGTRSDAQARTISVDTLDITDPADDAFIDSGDTCTVGAGVGYQVSVTVDEALDGESYSIAFNGGTAATGTVSGATISTCVPVADGTGNFVATVAGITDSVPATVFVSGPAAGIIIDPLPAPGATDPDHRDGVTVTWDQPTEDFEGQLVRYELRCDATALLASATAEDKETWWDEATQVTLPPELTPDDANPEAFFAFRPEDPQHCLMRAFDAGDQGTLLTQTTDVTLRLRTAVLGVGPADQLLQHGYDVEPIGDINGDGFADVIASGFGYAAIYLGTSVGFSGTPDAEIVSSSALFNFLAVAGIGDFNGDGTGDFAIGDPDFDNDGSTARGRVSIFYGRTDVDAYDGVDIGGVCAADFCVSHDEADALFATAVAPAGDFNGDGSDDLAAGSYFYPNFASDGMFAVIAGDDYTTRACTGEGQCRANESCVLSECTLDSDNFWGLEVRLPSGVYVGNTPIAGTEVEPHGFFHTGTGGSQVGAPIAALGNIDGVAGDDLAVSAPGNNEVLLIAGEPAAVGFVEVASVTQISTNVGQTPGSPQPSWGYALAAAGDFYDPPGSVLDGSVDLLIGGVNSNRPRLVPGERAEVASPYFTAPEVPFVNTRAVNMGQAIATSFHTSLGSLGVLASDGQLAIALGSRLGDDVTIWYQDTFAAAAAAPPVSDLTGYQIIVPASEVTNVQFVGDVNGDGFNDIAVGDPGIYTGDPDTSDDGRVLLLY